MTHPAPRARVSSRAAAAILLLAVAAGGSAGPTSLPPIVFVSRAPLPGAAGAVPGLRPHHRASAAGGRRLLRERDGALRELAPGAFFDVSDPSVSLDGKRVAFAGLVGRDSAWRIYEVGLDGRGLRPLTRGGAGHDDLD